MSILDDAIREHLELKRQHGADEAELKRLEDEAFGPAGRPEEPDPFAEAPTEFMTEPGASGGSGAEAADEDRRRINIADLQEPPPAPAESEPQEPQVEVAEEVAPEADAAPPAPAEDTAQAAPPAEEEPPAIEHEIEEPVADDSADERHAIAEQPTELFDVGAELGTEDATEIKASRTEAPEEPPAEEYEEDEEFWSDQRLSEELDQALEAPLAETEDVESEDDEEDEDDEYEAEDGHEDVLEDTPDFLEDAPEDDELWFEQRPPKDFDFDD